MVTNYDEYINALRMRVKDKLDTTSLYQFKGTVPGEKLEISS